MALKNGSVIMIQYLSKTGKILISLSAMFAMTFFIHCKKDEKPISNPDELVEYTGFLKIPGVGFQTFFRFEDEDQNLLQPPIAEQDAEEDDEEEPEPKREEEQKPAQES